MPWGAPGALKVHQIKKLRKTICHLHRLLTGVTFIKHMHSPGQQKCQQQMALHSLTGDLEPRLSGPGKSKLTFPGIAEEERWTEG